MRRSRTAVAALAAVLFAVVAMEAEGQSRSGSDPWAGARRAMVEQQIRERGVRQPAVLDAMETVPRHLFIPPEHRDQAYSDAPLPIGRGQTISQPYIVALMTELLDLDKGDKVLEIGTGSGYHAAVLSRVAGEVYTIEILDDLARQAKSTLEQLGYGNVHVRNGDGYKGWPEAAPFDAIVVDASGPEIPPALCNQLAPGGRLVMPVGRSTWSQHLVKLTRTGDGIFREEDLGAVSFVPLIGAQGWPEPGDGESFTD